MHMMTAKDWRTANTLVHAVHGSAEEMPLDVLAGVGALVGCDSASFSQVDHRGRRLLNAIAVPQSSNLYPADSFHHVFDQHPGFAAHATGRLAPGTATAWSDLIGAREMRRLPLFVDFFKPRDTHDQLLSVIQVDHRHGGVLAFNRSRRGFDGRQRAIVETMVAHLRQAAVRRSRLATLTAAAGRRHRTAEHLHRAASRLSELTVREREVAATLVDGDTDRQIAGRLGISERTVHKHLENIYRKLGLDTRAKVVAVLVGQTAQGHRAPRASE
jgi:DNA-binding CsgD family transcriptional regulator